MKKKQFWVDTLGEGWAMELKDVLKSPYMEKLLKYLSEEYKIYEVKPRKKDVFNAFKLCPWESLKIVIIGKEPHINTEPNGLAFGNHNFSLFNDVVTSLICDSVVKEYYSKYHYLDFDFTLKSWASQGILLLNRSLTARDSFLGTHKKPWGKFISAVLNSINESKSSTIFMLWGKEAQLLEPHIKKHNYVLKCDDPHDYIGTRKCWNCSNFKEANKILMKLNKEKIKW